MHIFSEVSCLPTLELKRCQEGINQGHLRRCNRTSYRTGDFDLVANHQATTLESDDDFPFTLDNCSCFFLFCKHIGEWKRLARTDSSTSPPYSVGLKKSSSGM